MSAEQYNPSDEGMRNRAIGCACLGAIALGLCAVAEPANAAGNEYFQAGYGVLGVSLLAGALHAGYKLITRDR